MLDNEEKILSEKIIRFFEKDRFATENGIRLLEAAPGKASARLELTPHYMNAAGGVQGGAIFTLCDLAFAAAANAGGTLTLGINSSISFFRQASGTYLTARARELSRSRKLCYYQVDVFDGEENLIASFTGTGYIKGNEISFG